MPRIWFNRSFATTSHLVAMLRDNPEGRRVEVIGSHPDPDSPALAGCDESYVEPVLPAIEYVQWALQFAREHDVTVLFPRLAMAELADAADQFAAAGTQVAAVSGATARLFEDKAAAYAAARALGLAVPPHHVVDDSVGLQVAYEKLRPLGPVCLKPVHGVGGVGFRILSTDPPSLAELDDHPHPSIELARVCAALDAAHQDGQPVEPLLISPYLTGPEISVDALATTDGITLAAIGRLATRRRRRIVDDAPARAVAVALNAAHRVGYLSNTQVRYWQGPDDDGPLPYLLELNTRASGGVFQTALAGVNLPWAAVKMALGEPVEPLAPRFGAAFTTVAALVALDEVP